MKLIGLCGFSDSGKTTLLRRLIEILTRRGYSCAAVKWCSHSFDLNPEGKDSWHFLRAGARGTAVLSPEGYAVMGPLSQPPDFSEFAVRWFGDMDFVFIEGGSYDPSVKIIEVLRSGGVPRTPREQLLALVSQEAVQAGCPVFSPQEEEKIADLLEREVKL